MPYFIYKMNAGPTALIKHLEKIEEHNEYKTAKDRVREIRATQAANDTATYKVIFAPNALAAEEQLMEHREAPIMREWEK
ncbi:MAG: hypothetical protein OEZ39_06980 [Gammaproteobacteria bacterium]|nr:hypothetical protein [Gammaproteobacteria bacterium]MDH5651600.1 hypothetical protein [Gammaproteobacteria bacterium]